MPPATTKGPVHTKTRVAILIRTTYYDVRDMGRIL